MAGLWQHRYAAALMMNTATPQQVWHETGRQAGRQAGRSFCQLLTDTAARGHVAPTLLVACVPAVSLTAAAASPHVCNTPHSSSKQMHPHPPPLPNRRP